MEPSLFPIPPTAACRASVIIPARNEEEGIRATLQALANQVDLLGDSLDPDSFEVLLLLNNCTDATATVAAEFAQAASRVRVHIAEISLPPEQAHVGTARRLLMDAACARLEQQSVPYCAILSTDADTLVAPDWIAANLAEVEQGAEVVGGVIHLFPEDLDGLATGTRIAYHRDRRYQALVAQLESILDPDPADPWPRHLEHFGASLACACEAYRRSGGLPAVKPLEDVAFIDALRKVGARIRHSPQVHIFTSARLDGRAEVGLSGQLRHWQRESEQGEPHIAESAEWLAHRFTSIANLRRFNRAKRPYVRDYPAEWQQKLRDLHAQELPTARFLELLDCNALIEETFTGSVRREEITSVLEALERLIATHQPAAARPVETEHASAAQPIATLAG